MPCDNAINMVTFSNLCYTQYARIGTAQMEKDIEKNVMKLVQDNKKEMEEQTGISTSMTDENIREYLQQVIEERQKKNT